MNFQSIVKFYLEDENYLTIQSEYKEEAYAMVLSTVYALLAMLYFGNHKFDDDVIDHLLRKVEELRDCPHSL